MHTKITSLSPRGDATLARNQSLGPGLPWKLIAPAPPSKWQMIGGVYMVRGEQ